MGAAGSVLRRHGWFFYGGGVISPWKLVGWVFVGLLLIGGAVWWNRRKDSRYEADKAAWKAELHARDSVLADVVRQRDEASLANTRSVPIYLEGKTRIIHDAAGTSAAPAVQACFELADQRISACEKSRKADSAVIVAQQAKIKTLESKPEPREKRFQFYGAAGYSVRVDSAGTQMAPAFRVGIDSKLIGPVRLMTDGQLSLPGKGHAQSLWQANVMARVNF